MPFVKFQKALAVWTILAVSPAFSPVFAQEQGSQGQAQQPTAPPPSGGGTTGPPAGGAGESRPTIPDRTPTIPNPGQQQQQDPWGRQGQRPYEDMQRPLYLSGKVVTSDGQAPPDQVVIERICNGVVRPEAYTDSKGRFQFQLGQNQSMMADASVSGGAVGMPGPPGSPMSGGISERQLMGCEIRASLPGFRSETISLAGRRFMDSPDIGTIVLHRLGNVEGSTVSMTSLTAPKDAKKAYEKGRNNVNKKKWPDAVRELEKAVALHPTYAAAWYELGRAYLAQNDVDKGKNALEKALSSDPKYLMPYSPLALIAAQGQKWQEVIDITSRLIQLDPADFPQAYFYAAVANYNLHRTEEAEKMARQGIKIDTYNRYPKMHHLLGVLQANKQDYAGATESMKLYLKFAPNASDAENVRKQLAEMEKSASARQGAPAQP